MLAETYNGYSIKMSRTTDKTVSLHERTRMANNWGAHYLLSIHVNAGGGTGFESFIYNGSFRNKTRTNELRSVIHKNIIEATKFVDRGKRSEEHTSELQSRGHLVCRLLLEKKKKNL